MVQCKTEADEILLKALGKSFGQFIIFGRQVQYRVDGLSHIIIKPGHDDPVEVFLNILCGVNSLGPHQFIDKQDRLNDLQVEHPKGSESDQAQLRIFKRNRIPCSPLEIRKYFYIYEIDFSPKGAGESPREAEDLG